MANRLATEQSPYLLQHADNPVDWYPWGEDAFEKARADNKPIFLSIGYSTCHWCHVMARESFESEEIAELMNRTFVNIKLDREERPDIDSSCMKVCQLLTGHGGWPLNIVMTPDREPFFAATYIPRTGRFNRPGMAELIPQIGRAWHEERPRIMKSVEAIRSGVAKTLQFTPGDVPGSELFPVAVESLVEQYDEEIPGFGGPPRFPMPMTLSCLFQYGKSANDSRATEMATEVLKQMRAGGVYDQIGYGFHRYSTDREWRLPHFEKMLSDQALLMHAYMDGYRMTGKPMFRQTVMELAEYVHQRLTSPEGGFWSAEDADSDGIEGKYYFWNEEEIREQLSPEDADLACRIYRTDPDGNVRNEATGRKTGANVLWPGCLPEEKADELGMKPEELSDRLKSIRTRLLEARSRRTPPRIDDKILTDWNGLMISALSRAGGLFEDPKLVERAEKAFDFIRQHLTGEDEQLLHRYRNDQAGILPLADDYTFMIRAVIDLYQSTHDPDYLQIALHWNQQFIELFHDNDRGGFYLNHPSTEAVLAREKPIVDGALPSCNSAAAMNLIRLSRLTGQTRLEEHADRIFSLFSSQLGKMPEYSLHALQALMTASQPSAEIVVCSGTGKYQQTTDELIRTVRRWCLAPYVLLFKKPEWSEKLASLAPYTEAFPQAAQPRVWVCHRFRCEQPVETPRELRDLLEKQGLSG